MMHAAAAMHAAILARLGWCGWTYGGCTQPTARPPPDLCKERRYGTCTHVADLLLTVWLCRLLEGQPDGQQGQPGAARLQLLHHR